MPASSRPRAAAAAGSSLSKIATICSFMELILHWTGARTASHLLEKAARECWFLQRLDRPDGEFTWFRLERELVSATTAWKSAKPTRVRPRTIATRLTCRALLASDRGLSTDTLLQGLLHVS